MDIPFTDIHTHGQGSRWRLRCFLPSDSDFGSRLACRPFSTGVHPWHAACRDAGRWTEQLEDEPCAAVGEIGLDAACGVDMQLQTAVFDRQLQVAARRGLPVVLHVVRSFEAVMNILRRYDLPAVVFHGFVGSAGQALRAARKGYFLSAGPRSLLSARSMDALAAVTPNLLVESDDSGQDLCGLYCRVGQAIGIDSSVLAGITYANYRKLVRL